MEELLLNKANADGMGLFGLKEVDTFLVPLAVEQFLAYVVNGSSIGSRQACPHMKPQMPWNRLKTSLSV